MRPLALLLFSSIAAAQTTPVAEVTSGSEEAVMGVGARVRYITLPEWFHDIYTDESVALHSAAFGAEFTWRRSPDFDWLFGVEYGLYSPPDGNWLGNGEEPAGEKTDYVHFDGVNMISIDATAVWNTKFSRWFTLTYGAGLGVGFITGDMIRAASSQGGQEDAPCNRDQLGDTSECYPPGCGPDGCSDAELAVMRNQRDPFGDPDVPKCEVNGQEVPCAAFVDDTVPPAIPVIHLLVGARFTLHRHFELRVDGGFHNAFFLGAAGHYLF